MLTRRDARIGRFGGAMSELPTERTAAADRTVAPRFGARLGTALRLLRQSQKVMLAMLIVARVSVGLCDLMVAAALYLLFVLLQGTLPAHAIRWVPQTILPAAAMTAGLILLRIGLDLFSTRSVVKYAQHIYADFLIRLTDGYGEMRWPRFVERNRSELLNHATYTSREAADFYRICIELSAAVIVVAIMAGALIYQSQVAAYGLGVSVVIFYIVHRFLLRKKLQAAAAVRESSLRMLNKNLMEVFSSGKEIRTYRNGLFFRDRIDAQIKRFTASSVRASLLPQIARIFADQGVVLLFLGAVMLVEMRHGDMRQLVSVLVFYFVLSRRILPLVSQVSFMAGQMESTFENVRALERELDDCEVNRATIPLGNFPAHGFVAELERVSFAFAEGNPVFQDVSLLLSEGEIVVLRGVSGSGKSSLMNLLAGVLQPASGLVRIDGTSVAYVPQEVALLDDSIRNNLLFGLPDISDAALRKVLASARLADFVDAQLMGLDTRVGDNGVLLSGGQRQRLGLARAMLRGAKLLLLDEATSALDEVNEAEVLVNLAASGAAIVLVSHRSQIHRFATRVLRLEDGRLIEERHADVSIENEETATLQ
jgi:ABC-type multidrug transport system fused ATPase/permease subunit